MSDRTRIAKGGTSTTVRFARRASALQPRQEPALGRLKHGKDADAFRAGEGSRGGIKGEESLAASKFGGSNDGGIKRPKAHPPRVFGEERIISGLGKWFLGYNNLLPIPRRWEP